MGSLFEPMPPDKSQVVPSLLPTDRSQGTEKSREIKIFQHAVVDKAELFPTYKAKIGQASSNLKYLTLLFSQTISHSEEKQVQELFSAARNDFASHFDRAPLTADQLILVARIFRDVHAVGKKSDSHNYTLRAYDEAIKQLVLLERFDEAEGLRKELVQTVPVPHTSPFYALMRTLDEKTEKVTNRGIYIPAGTSAVIDNVIHVTKKTVEDDQGVIHNVVELDAKLEQSTAQSLQLSLEKLAENPPSGVSVKKTAFTYLSLKEDTKTYSPRKTTVDIGEKWEVSVEGVGTFSVGCDPNFGCIYDRCTITLDIDSQKSPQKYGEELYTILSLMGISQAIAEPSQEDKERAKIKTLLWTFFPKVHSTMDPSQLATLSLPELQTLLDSKTDGAFSTIAQENRDKIAYKEVDIGYQIPFVRGQAELVKQQGISFLTHGLRGGYDADSWEKTALFLHEKILTSGLIPSEDRAKMGILGAGLSIVDDHMFGAAGNVFLRAIPENALDKDNDVCEMTSESIVLLINPSVFDGRTYEYQNDCFGICNVHATAEDFKTEVDRNWRGRDTAPDFARRLSENWSSSNEVMVHKSVLPSELYGIVVNSEQDRSNLIGALSKYRQEINGIPLNRCIIASKSLTNTMKQEKMS